MTRAAQSGEAAGFMRAVEVALNAANVTQDPSYLDHFNFDQAVPDVAEIQGVPLKWMNTLEQVQALRQQRAQAQQQQAMVQALPGVAAMTKAGTVAAQAGV